jgi:hypothetical protein
VCIVCTHKLGGDRFQLADVVQVLWMFTFCSVVHSSLCLLGQHYLVTSLKFMALVLRVQDGSICNSIGEPSAKLHNVYDNPTKCKSHSILLSSIVSPIDSESNPIIEGLTPLLIIDISVDSTKTSIKDKVKLVND